MEYDLSIISKALWENLNLQTRIDKWAESRGIQLRPLHRIEPTNLSPDNGRKRMPKSIEELDIEYRKLSSNRIRAEFLTAFSNNRKEEQVYGFFLDWIEQEISILEESLLLSLEQKLILSIIRHKIEIEDQAQGNNSESFIEEDTDNPFIDISSQMGNSSIKSDFKEEELVNLAEKVALEQALCGKTAQELEEVIEILFPMSGSVILDDKLKKLKRTLLDILGGKHGDYSDVSSPIKTVSPGRSFRKNTNMDIFKRKHGERNALRRLSDKEVMLKRILDHRVISMEELSQSQSNKKSGSMSQFSQASQLTPSQQQSIFLSPSQSTFSGIKSPQVITNDRSRKESGGIFKFKRLPMTTREDVELPATQ
jgi:hypothetical protein